MIAKAAFLVALGLGVALSTGSCGGSTGPDSGDQVEITLAVSGGLASADWQYTIDGRAGRVTGDRCVGELGCDWEAGQELATFDPDRLTAVAREFFERDFFEGPEDYGPACCDHLNFALTYRDAEHDRTVRGSGGSLPAELLGLIDVVTEFVQTLRAERLEGIQAHDTRRWEARAATS